MASFLIPRNDTFLTPRMNILSSGINMMVWQKNKKENDKR